MTSWSSVVFQTPLQLVLSTAGQHMQVASMLRVTLRIPAVRVWIKVGLTHLNFLWSVWPLQNDSFWLLCVIDREICQALVLHAEWHSGCVCVLSLRDQPWHVQRGNSLSCSFHTFLWAVPWPHLTRTFLFVFLLPHRTACMTAVTVRKVRSACVLQFPPMFMPVQLKESSSVAGGTPPVVSSEKLWNKMGFARDLEKSRGLACPKLFWTSFFFKILQF